jgi:glycosyltransferase involved in cell wall biosynthesis
MADTFYTWDDRLVFRVYWPMARLAASKATLLVVPSQKVRRFWRLSGLPENKIRVTRLFVSILNIDKACLKEAKEIEEKLGFRKKVLFVGRLVPGKGVEYLLKAFARASAEIDGAGLIIIGDGPQRTRLEKLSIDMKLSNVIFLGFVSRDKIAPYYLVSDILVLPSFKTRTHEEWGLVVNEAMSVGKPVIVTESVGCSYELVKNYVNGLIVPDKNTVALYKAIKMLLTDDELRYKMGKEAKKTIINGFTYKQEVDDYLQIIKDALNRNCKIKK